MNRRHDPCLQFVWLLSLVVLLSFTGTASFSGHFVDTCDRPTELSAIDHNAGMNSHGDLADIAAFENESQTRHIDAGCAAQLIPALSSSGCIAAYTQALMDPPIFIDPVGFIRLDLNYSLHRPPNV